MPGFGYREKLCILNMYRNRLYVWVNPYRPIGLLCQDQNVNGKLIYKRNGEKNGHKKVSRRQSKIIV